MTFVSGSSQLPFLVHRRDKWMGKGKDVYVQPIKDTPGSDTCHLATHISLEMNHIVTPSYKIELKTQSPF